MKSSLCLFFWLHVSVAAAEVGAGATLGNLTSPVDTKILLEHRLYDVVWGGEHFVAVGQGTFDETEVFLSPDGVGWERVSLGKPSRPLGVSGDGAGALYGVAWNGSSFVAVGERILTSTEGKSWTITASFSSCIFSDVVTHGEMLVAVGGDRGRGCLARSSDGKSWTEQTASLDSNNAVLTSIHETNAGLLAVGNANLGKLGLSSVFLFSADGGKSWIRQLGPLDFLIDLAGNDSLLVAVGGLAQRGAIFTSSDTRNWTERPTTLQRSLRAVVWNGASFVAVGAEGVIVTSANGMTWAEQSSGVAEDLLSIAWNGSRFVVVGEGVILTSPDGVHWKPPRYASSSSTFAEEFLVG